MRKRWHGGTKGEGEKGKGAGSFPQGSHLCSRSILDMFFIMCPAAYYGMN